ncbi:DUF4199 domain-containing protein [Larkinella terrae]|uniref:DUF4199 family protein n=1 Tax=Larkinella terrae TaxID=2025311 RepID=A0A7K0EFB0_9BACT|nr:DUF4199 domain-containing protein [Larkinella terrae]MRS60533.1 DUF4199 family protein [Larkinella terrae]
MKKIILICGFIAGFVLTTVMAVSTVMCYMYQNFESNMALGYASMVLAFSLIFVGIKNYRDTYNNQIISFGKAFKIGLYITLIASTMYVITWLIEYYVFIPDFMDKYTAHVLREAKTAGASTEELASKSSEMDMYKKMYKNPLFVVLLTYAEVFPIGLVISLICALILKRNDRNLAPTA